MAGGLMAFFGGLIIFKSSSNEKHLRESEAPMSASNTASVIEKVDGSGEMEVVKEKEIVDKVPDDHYSQPLEQVIEMAVADGILTDNEKKVIKRIAEEKDLDYTQIITDTEARLLNSNLDSETVLIDVNKKKGDDFEKFIVQKFNKKYFHIKEWAGDKYIDGRYAQTTLHPDLLMEFHIGERTDEFAVECKWKSNITEKGIVFASKEQYSRYKRFEVERKVPVFIAIGLGGKALMPEKLYIVPLRLLTSNFVFPGTLEKFEKNDKKGFFYDYKDKALR